MEGELVDGEAFTGVFLEDSEDEVFGVGGDLEVVGEGYLVVYLGYEG